jgi:methylmalonyl-CoA decarboxylase
MSLVSVDLRESIGTIAMEHAERRNALSGALIGEIISALEDFDRRKVRVVVLRAAPGVRVWSAGHDVRELPRTRRDPLGWSDPLRTLVRTLEEFRAPIIALIEGGVWGGACEVALACDIVVAAPSATFAITPARIGIPYNASGLLTFMNAIPLHVLKEMAFSAAGIDAERAADLGMVNHVVPAEEIESFADGLARRIAANSPLSIAVMKEQMRLLAGASSITPGMFERLQGLRRVVYDSRNYQEGIEAFLEKRRPTFTGA